MTGAPIFISLSILDALLIWAIIRTRGEWFIKIVVMVLVLSFNFVTWNSLGTYRGWPTRDALPKSSIFLAGEIDEPSPINNDPGHIDLWLVPTSSKRLLFGYNPTKNEPRAYREPFSQQLEQAVLQAQAIQKKTHGQGTVGLKMTKPPKRHGRSSANARLKLKPVAYLLPPANSQVKRGEH